MGLIVPEWPAPANVRAVFTTRENGFSSGVYQGLNLGAHVGDAQESVEKNRRQLQQQLGLTRVLCQARDASQQQRPRVDSSPTSRFARRVAGRTDRCGPWQRRRL